MEYKEFAESLQTEVSGRIEGKVDIQEILKNNGVRLIGLSIHKEGAMSVSPTIYIEKYFEEFKDGRGMTEIAEEIIRVYESNKATDDFEIGKLKDFNEVKEHIFFKLVNGTKNEEMLKNMPHKRFLDLAKVYYIEVSSMISTGHATVNIKNDVLGIWNVDAGLIEKTATENTEKKLPVQMISMNSILKELMADAGNDIFDSDICGDDMDASESMFVVSNVSRYMGAAVMAYAGAMKKIAAELEDDLIILPSSLHEVILMRYRDVEEMDKIDQLKEMVNDVNTTQVAPEEILSYSIYRYDRADDKISIIA